MVVSRQTWILGGVVLAVALLGCSSAARPKPYTHEEFDHKVLGLSADDVRSALGAPDRIMSPMSFQPNGNEGYWIYSKKTVNETGELDESVNVWFTHGRCDQTQFMRANPRIPPTSFTAPANPR